jgi:putative oxidoreductase
MEMVDLGLLVLRVGVGAIFAVHGAQKLFGWWGGPGVVGWRGAVEHMGYRPAPLFAALSTGAEFVGGLLLVVGFLTPIAGAVLIAQSVVIVGAAHWRSGFFNTAGGFEFPLTLLIGVVSVLLSGAGAYSVDGWLGISVAPEVSLGLIVLGFLAGLGVLAVPGLAEEATAEQS